MGCILTGDWEADMDCTAWHQEHDGMCCKWCWGGEHCGMCDRWEDPEDDPPLCGECHEFPARSGPLCLGCATPDATGDLIEFEVLDDVVLPLPNVPRTSHQGRVVKRDATQAPPGGHAARRGPA